MAVPTSISGEIARVADEQIRSDEDHVAVEEPLEIRLGKSPITVTMRTPGCDQELAAGFLFTEGIVHSPDDIAAITGPMRDLPNVVSIQLRRGIRFDRGRIKRNFYTNSSCGVCGKTTLQALEMKTEPISSGFKVPLALLYSLPERLREEQETFEETGGLHASAVFDGTGGLLYLREDVGRHNAVDKVVGAALLERRIPLDHHILMVSGRTSFEIMQKALVARIPIVAAISAPSSLAVALAREFKMTLVGFLRGRRFNVYAGKERIAP
ncbi:MAG: formate dehydrogenase accessory sulfurtransferase FdhD [Deltaproteobacteria bacterium]|nr:formate dehydrogenase accessory sulfurtransferase FdhD [Deltaproteobacteria bacterium]